jgi:ComF family protein
MKNETHLCAACINELPLTNFHLNKDNSVEKTFWGRIVFEKAFAMLHFSKEGMVQKMLHQIKYKGNKDLAVYLGEMYGGMLKTKGITADGLIAIPLHKSKLRKRGYNQSDYFVQGLSTVLQIPILSNCVTRISATESQTRKSRFARWENVQEVFSVVEPSVLEHKHILICDDVITTGATIEGLCKVLPKTSKFSICAIATPSQ